MKLRKLKHLVDQSRAIPSEEVMIDIHHEFMKSYGWVPFDEFKKMKISQISALMRRINDDKETPEIIPVIIVGYAKKTFAKRLMKR